MLNKEIKIHLKCDAFLCEYEWLGTEEQYNKMLSYDGESLNHYPTRQQHKNYLILKEGKCPHCVERENANKNPPKPEFKRGGVIPSYSHCIHPRIGKRIK